MSKPNIQSSALTALGIPPALTTVAVQTSAYTAAANQLVPCDASTAGFIITLPTSPADKTKLTIKKVDASTNVITITAGGSDVFNKAGGVTSLTLSLQNQTVTIQYSLGTSIWYVVGDDLPLSQLDSHYSVAYAALNDSRIINAADAQTAKPLPTSSGVITLDCSQGYVWYGTVTGAFSLNLTNLPSSGTIAEVLVKVTQDGTGGRAFGGWKVVGTTVTPSYDGSGIAPTVSSAANVTTFLNVLTYDGGATLTAQGSIPAIDVTQADYQPVGAVAATGSTGLAADAGHVHQGVTQVVAGSGLTVTSTDGTGHGVITISSSAGSGFHAGIYGDGSDGAITLDGSTAVGFATLASSVYTLSRDVFATTLTINSGVTLKSNSYRVFATTSITNVGNINVDGNAGSATGTGGANVSAGTLGAQVIGGAGNTGAGTAGTSAGYGTNASAAGGTGSSAAGGAAASALSGPAVLYLYRLPAAVMSGVFAIQNASHTFSGSSSGSGGGGDGTNKGGGGGGGAGILFLASPSITNSGTLSAKGGAGGTPTTGNCGGGGGAAGGLIIAWTSSAWTAGTTVVSGGTSGSGVGTGTAGGTAGTGSVLNVIFS